MNMGMGLLYVFSTEHEQWYLVIPTAVFHALTVISMLTLAWVDPGFIVKVHPEYEKG